VPEDPANAEAPPGLARERTSLAWTRTVLAIIVAGALLLRSGVGLGGFWELPGAVAIAGGLLVLAVSLRREHRAASPTLLRTIGIGVTLLCLASLTLTFAESERAVPARVDAGNK